MSDPFVIFAVIAVVVGYAWAGRETRRKAQFSEWATGAALKRLTGEEREQ